LSRQTIGIQVNKKEEKLFTYLDAHEDLSDEDENEHPGLLSDTAAPAVVCER
jgi:hypothetical protein